MLVGSGCAYSSTPAAAPDPTAKHRQVTSRCEAKKASKQTGTTARVPCTPWLWQGPLTGSRAGKRCGGKQAAVVRGAGWLLGLPLPQDRGRAHHRPGSDERLKAPTPTGGP